MPLDEPSRLSKQSLLDARSSARIWEGSTEAEVIVEEHIIVLLNLSETGAVLDGLTAHLDRRGLNEVRKGKDLRRDDCRRRRGSSGRHGGEESTEATPHLFAFLLFFFQFALWGLASHTPQNFITSTPSIGLSISSMS